MDEPASGAWNMAADEYLLRAARQGKFPATLRFFSWVVPTLSLGYTQSIKEFDTQKIKDLHWDLVRRPTGGRAILHVDEVTYSITAPLSSPIASGSILESYRRISNAFVCSLNTLGITAMNNKQYELPAGSSQNGAVCFEIPSNFEITVNGKKLIGSAQARKSDAMLQHGALPVCGDLTRINQVLNYPTELDRNKENGKLLQHATTIEIETGKVFSSEEIRESLRSGFSKEFRIDFIEETYTADELEGIQNLVESKYATPEWNFRI